ncbi:phosphonate C-P lyase system protein PhnH [Halomonas piscis]|uniref:Phosphonate C-P lyase system protein PhnH n=1 Tax=Halomonas piscis TaxID=3031727 RepID=A0ABY9Z0C8_9GAMM|nr:phosphonate C-P lyase system protein PhnH [Halomonas piscis]WNK20288.1 phosphonate C-P lyase system protein PhnH [Halomonas piscis]
MLWPAFNDPVHDSQRLFRQLLQAMAEPGTLEMLRAPEPPREASIGPALWGVLLTLCDLDTPLWIAGELDSPSLREALRFHTGCPVTEDSAAAEFALLTSGTLAREIEFATGSDAYPNRGATLLIAIDHLEAPGPWQLSGPGIADRRHLDIGDADDLMTRLNANRTSFPRGIDVILTCNDRLVAIPRSTRVERTNQEVRPCMSP